MVPFVLLRSALAFTVMILRCRSLSSLIVFPAFVISALLITLSNFTFCASYLISRLFDYPPFGAASLLPGSIAGCERCEKVDVSKLVNIWLGLQRAAPCEQWCYFCSRAWSRNLCCNARNLNVKPKTLPTAKQNLLFYFFFFYFLSHINCQSAIAAD